MEQNWNRIGNLCVSFYGLWGVNFWCRPFGSLRSRICGLCAGAGCRWSHRERWWAASAENRHHPASANAGADSVRCCSESRAKDWPMTMTAVFDSASYINTIEIVIIIIIIALLVTFFKPFSSLLALETSGISQGHDSLQLLKKFQIVSNSILLSHTKLWKII